MLEFFEHYSVSCASCPKNHESVDLRGGGGASIYIYVLPSLSLSAASYANSTPGALSGGSPRKSLVALNPQTLNRQNA